MRVNRLLLLFSFLMFVSNIKAQSIPKNQINAFQNFKDSCNGENWKFNDLNILKKRTEIPYVKTASSTYGQIRLFDLRNNNLEGVVPDNFMIDVENGIYDLNYGHGSYFDIYLSWNKITKVTPYILFPMKSFYNGKIWLDHNNLTSFLKPYEEIWGEPYGSDVYSGLIQLCLHNNEITDLPLDHIADGAYYSRINNRAELVRVDNNRLSFKDLIPLNDHLKDRTKYIDGQVPGNPDFKFICAPQKALGADSDEILNSGDALNMEFSLTRDDNVYQWTLNG
ncbi:MAG: hypothetical protein N4A72_20895, partial [Bacteroidales bacterium]|nr:hypothetical protein [Bacteroidales bacterium]